MTLWFWFWRRWSHPWRDWSWPVIKSVTAIRMNQGNILIIVIIQPAVSDLISDGKVVIYISINTSDVYDSIDIQVIQFRIVDALPVPDHFAMIHFLQVGIHNL